jgi:hypothetical protein
MTDVRAKALAYYRDNHVHVLGARTHPGQRAPYEVVAVVEGYTAARFVELKDAVWTCSCQAAVSDGQTCAHVGAVQQCTDPANSVAAKPAKSQRSAA